MFEQTQGDSEGQGSQVHCMESQTWLRDWTTIVISVMVQNDDVRSGVRLGVVLEESFLALGLKRKFFKRKKLLKWRNINLQLVGY